MDMIELADADDRLLNKALTASAPAEYEMEEPESTGPYTCIRCLAGTWNDSDICGACAEEARALSAKDETP